MELEQRIAEDAGLLRRWGIEVDETTEGLLLRLQVDETMVNAGGMCHGGFLFALADTACAYALGREGFKPATVDASITYLKSALRGDLVTARPRVLKAGRLLGHCEVCVENQQGERLASFRGSCINAGRVAATGSGS